MDSRFYIIALEERFTEIRELLSGEISPKALKILSKAECKLDAAIQKASEGKLDQFFDKLNDVIYYLQDATKYCLDTSKIIEAILIDIRDVISLKITDAGNSLMGTSNKDIDKDY